MADERTGANKTKRRPLVTAVAIFAATVVFFAGVAMVGALWLARSRAAYQKHRNPNIAPLAESLRSALPAGTTYALASTSRDSSGESETYTFNIQDSLSFAELSGAITSWSQREFGNPTRFRCFADRLEGGATVPGTCGWEVDNYRFVKFTRSAIVAPVPRTDGRDPTVRISELSVRLHSSE
ncbi:MAG: hypothetical protein DCC49_12955 [Acidobacteria bacterium]|nr:MAG: hypothetical protein DCC49_12955 [Acidobacteriota bacterium]